MYITEEALYYVWQNGIFNPEELKTTSGESITVIKKGKRNSGEGPDFLEVEILINGLRMFGSMEIHVHSSDWLRHRHHENSLYDSVILHIVYFADGNEINRTDGVLIPELEISGYIKEKFINIYEKLHQANSGIPCKAVIQNLTADKSKDKEYAIDQISRQFFMKRIERKASELSDIFHRNAGNWHETLWQSLAGAFGGTTNKQPFEELARRLSYFIILKNRGDLISLEALLFGYSGLLSDINEPDEYTIQLTQIWKHLKNKFQFDEMPSNQFYFGKIRPVNFPTVRLAQLAVLIRQLPDLQMLIENPKLTPEIFLSIQASSYWDHHYRLSSRPSIKPIAKRIGKEFAMGIVINCMIPLSVLFFTQTGRKDSIAEIIELSEQLPPEKNSIVDEFDFWKHNWTNASQTQALLELKKYYCSAFKCTECPMGIELFKE